MLASHQHGSADQSSGPGSNGASRREQTCPGLLLGGYENMRKQTIEDRRFPIHAPVKIRIRMSMKIQGIKMLNAGKLPILLSEIQLAAAFPSSHSPAGEPR